MDDAKVLPTSEISVRFQITEISKMQSVLSREVIVQDVPWYVEASKKPYDGKQSLGIYLFSAKKDKLLDWTHAAYATFKLIPFDSNKDAITHTMDPMVFTNNGTGYGGFALISWTELFNPQNSFVKDDTITLKIKIKTEDPSVERRSKLQIEYIDRSFTCGYLASYRLEISNISSLMAVQSPEFILHSLPWSIITLKTASDFLTVRLNCKEILEKVFCKIKMSVKLVSSKNGVEPVERMIQDRIRCNQFFNVSLLSWDKLLKPENGYVNDDSIELDVEIKIDKPEGDIPENVKVESKPLRMECAICLESIENREVSAPRCGHLFCTACITKVINENGKICPTCKSSATLKTLCRIYLPK